MALVLTILALSAGAYVAIQNAGSWVSYVIIGIVVVFVGLACINPNTAMGFLGISIFLFAMLGFSILFVKFLPQFIGAGLFLLLIFTVMYAVGNLS